MECKLCGLCKHSWVEYDDDRSYHYCNLGLDKHNCDKFEKNDNIETTKPRKEKHILIRYVDDDRGK